MARHQKLSRGWYRLWTFVNGAVLVALAAFVLQPALTATTGTPGATGSPDPAAGASSPTPLDPSAAVVTTKADLLEPGGRLRFGLSSPQSPWSPSEVKRLASAAGAHPTMLQYFVKWNEPLKPEAIELSYRQGALPVISWEPWAGTGASPNQPRYALRTIHKGEHDAYIRQVAESIRDDGRPVALRFAHEMNGVWYPWSERNSGNRKGDYVKAWRHVHDMFRSVGTENVIWVWSPNILRPVPNVSIPDLYPGDAYVDWLGLVGYAVPESKAGPVFNPTLKVLRDLSDKPILITETGARPGPAKVGWIKDFFRWLPRQPDVLGFIWFEFDDQEGGSSDWRFTASRESTAAFQAGLATLDLAPPPVG
jgi:hypothetical protein